MIHSAPSKCQELWPGAEVFGRFTDNPAGLGDNLYLTTRPLRVNIEHDMPCVRSGE